MKELNIQNVLEQIEEETLQMKEFICNTDFTRKVFLDHFGTEPRDVNFKIVILGDYKGWLTFEDDDSEIYVRLKNRNKDLVVDIHQKGWSKNEKTK